jgi:outer membrane cobalamin receptor
LDLNLNADYKINKNFTVFVMGNNLLNKKYEHYLGYKVLGAQVLGGIRIAF